MIDTREELIIALSEAAEVEHGLLIQYLFAAYSMKRREEEGITPRQQAIIIDWEESILEVAHEEMFHLAGVCNLLLAIGAVPQFHRPNFPQPMDAYYPFEFKLERFSDESLYRFIMAELPVGAAPPVPPGKLKQSFTLEAIAPEPLEYNRVGELYTLILDAFGRIPEKELFIGPKPRKDMGGSIMDRNSATELVKSIVLEGEGSPDNRKGSHYESFTAIRKELYKEIEKHSNFDPARPVVINPQTRKHRDANGEVTLIDHEITRRVAELFNHIYRTMLLILLQYYTVGEETLEQRVSLKKANRAMMSGMIRPLAEILTEMPVKSDPSAGNAGPTFELYSQLHLAPVQQNRWVILRERFIHAIKECDSLVQEKQAYTVLSRLQGIHQNLQYMLINLEQVFES